MHATYKNALMWTLYGVLFLLIAVLQTVVFGRARFFGVKLTLIPVCLACVAMLAGAEAGALYGLCCGAVWCFTGASGGAMHIVLLTICGAVIGYLCDRYLVRQLLSAVLMSLLALVFCQTILFLLQWHGPHRHDCCSADSDWPESALVPASVSWSLGDPKGWCQINAANFPLPHDRIHHCHSGHDRRVQPAAL